MTATADSNPGKGYGARVHFVVVPLKREYLLPPLPLLLFTLCSRFPPIHKSSYKFVCLINLKGLQKCGPIHFVMVMAKAHAIMVLVI